LEVQELFTKMGIVLMCDFFIQTEKQPPWISIDDGIPCGTHCYKMVCISCCITSKNHLVLCDNLDSENRLVFQTIFCQASKPDATIAVDCDMHIDVEQPTHSSDDTRNQLGSNKKKQGSSGRKAKSQQSESSSTQRVASESSDSEVHPRSNKSPQHSPCQSKVKINPRGGIKKSTTRRIAERILMSVKKGQREVAPSDSNSGDCLLPRDMKLRSGARNGHRDSVVSSLQNSPNTRSSRKKDVPQMDKKSGLAEDPIDLTEEANNEHSATDGLASSRIEDDENMRRQENNGRSWKVIEQGLLVKGLEIFGRNRLDPSPDDQLYISGINTSHLVFTCFEVLYNPSSEISCVALRNLLTSKFFSE
jgi:histone-lysine N-methyltransferase EZH2